MTGLQLFAFVILPITIAIGGAVAVFLHGRALDRRHEHRTPAE